SQSSVSPVDQLENLVQLLISAEAAAERLWSWYKATGGDTWKSTAQVDFRAAVWQVKVEQWLTLTSQARSSNINVYEMLSLTEQMKQTKLNTSITSTGKPSELQEVLAKGSDLGENNEGVVGSTGMEKTT
ncbi:hypothetical protein NDU88_001907, partial [Pleurodeles waltl]